MSTSVRVIAMFAVALGACAVRAQPAGYVIERVTVIDVERGEALAGRTVVIEGDTIRRIVESGAEENAAEVPEGYERIDGRGTYLIPGLFDAHVHYADPDTYGPLCIAHGVTFVREMGAFTEPVLSLREELNSGKRVGPEMICTGAIIDGRPPIWPFSEECETAEEGRAAVAKLADAGVDQIKVYSGLKRDVFDAIADEAKRRGLRIVGHIPEDVPLEHAMAAGQYTCEHLTGFAPAVARLAGKPLGPPTDAMAAHVEAFKAWSLLPTVPPEKLATFAQRVRESGMVVCPTLVVYRGIGRVGSEEAKADERLRSVSPHMMSFWETEIYSGFARHVDAGLGQIQAMVGALHAAGVPLMAGTDLANPYVFAGSSVHEEIELLRESGLSAVEALRAATTVPARVCGVAERLGTVREGKTASLVLLRADPLAKVGNVREIEAVFLRGKYFDRARLDTLLEEARRAASQPTSATVDVKVEVPGEVIARGVYRTTFNGMDAGTEEFALSREGDVYHLMSLALPKGGWEKPTAVRLQYNSQYRLVAAEWRKFDVEKTVATYAVREGEVEARATVGGKPGGEQTFALPEGAIVGGPAVASDYFLYNALKLAPGESREFPAVSFGYPNWRLNSLPITMRRGEDEELRGAGGEPIRARRYSFAQTIPGLGPVTIETWSDERGLVLRNSFKMPFGTIAWELQ